MPMLSLKLDLKLLTKSKLIRNSKKNKKKEPTKNGRKNNS